MNKVLVLIENGALTESGGLLIPGVIPALLNLQSAGYELVLYKEANDNRAPEAVSCSKGIQAMFESQGISFTHECSVGVFDATVWSAALAPQLLKQAIDTDNSFVIGSNEQSVALAGKLGISAFVPVTQAESGESKKTTSYSLESNKACWIDFSAYLCNQPRTSSIVRRSNETAIAVSLDLDTPGSKIHVSTGIGFFDHMLEQVAKHGGFSMQLDCKGDLHIDEHHTVEDCGLALGQALREALGDKRGIGRYGFVLPMDEAEVQVSMDLSARPYFVFNGEFTREHVGELTTEMVPHSFKSLSDTLGASLHITMRGENAHHQVEAIFKGVGRTIGQAIKKQGDELPTTKGML